MKAALAAAGLVTVFATQAEPPKQVPQVQLTPQQADQLQKEVSYKGALSMVKAAFFNEYCAEVSNKAPANVPAYKVERVMQPQDGLPESLFAGSFNYMGKQDPQAAATGGYCGALSYGGLKGPIADAQVKAFASMIDQAGVVAKGYAGQVMAKQANEETLIAAYGQLQGVAKSFQRAILMTLVEKPFNESGKPNLLAFSYSPARPMKAGDAQVNRILDTHMDGLMREVEEVEDALTIQEHRQQMPQPERSSKPDLHQTFYRFNGPVRTPSVRL